MDHEYWTKELREAEAELAAAKKRIELNAAAKKLQRAKAELKALEAETAKKRPAVHPSRRSGGRPGFVLVARRGAPRESVY